MADDSRFQRENSQHLGQFNGILVNFDSAVARKITTDSNGSWGFLLGSKTENEFAVIGAMKCIEKFDILTRALEYSKSEKDKIVSEIIAYLPEGVDIIGLFCNSESLKHDLLTCFEKTLVSFLKEFHFRKISQKFLLCNINKEKHFNIEFLDSENNGNHKFSDQTIETVCQDSIGKEWLENRLMFRLRASFQCHISIGKSVDSINQECHRAMSKLKEQHSVFIFENSDVIISKNTSEENWVGALDEIRKANSAQNITEVKVLSSLCKNELLQSDIYCPILMFNSFSEEFIQLNLDIDSIIYADKSCQIDEFILKCENSLCIQAINMILSTVPQDAGPLTQEMKAFHFYLDDCNHMITILYPDCDTDERNKTEDDLVSKRRSLHEMFFLAKRRPLLKKDQNHFHQISSEYLINPHLGLKSGIKDGLCAIVEGKYEYRHYMQDYFDDNGWGCAYRSLQTICSWFRLQGFTTKPVPNHKEIQDALVEIGDKPKRFSGSKQWIGSFEVNLCLEKLINVSSKILHVSSGAEMVSKGRELLDHFQDQGTPVMIGGGVLAHTILGVHFDELTGDIKFLILDPHYTGAENLKTVQDKGWCGWKSPKFWDQIAHYNMCLPQRPNMI